MDRLIAVFSNALFGNVVGIAGILLAIWAYFRTRLRPEISVHVRREQLVGANVQNALDGLAVTFEGVKIRSLSRAEVVVWNSGNTPFRLSDVVRSDNPSLRLPSGARALRVSEIRQSGQKGQVQTAITEARDRINLSWEYLNPGDGCALAVVYEGDATESISVSGTVVGVPTGLSLRITEPRSKRSRFEKTLLALLLFFAALGAIEILLDFPFSRWDEALMSPDARRVFLAYALTSLSGFTGAAMWALTRPNIPSSLDPKT
jgi:hypothetical protein